MLYNRMSELTPAELVDMLHAMSAMGAHQAEMYAAASEFLYSQLGQLRPG